MKNNYNNLDMNTSCPFTCGIITVHLPNDNSYEKFYFYFYGEIKLLLLNAVRFYFYTCIYQNGVTVITFTDLLCIFKVQF